MAKRFTDSAALAYITQPEAEPETITTTTPSEKTKASKETRSRRVGLLMQPSLYRQLEAIAEHDGISVNELIHLTMEQTAAQHPAADGKTT